MENETVLLALTNRPENELERFFAEKAIRENPAAVLSSVLSFEKAVYAFNDIKPNFETFEPLNTLCNAKGVQEILKIVPNWKFNREISYYLAYIAWSEGWVEMPTILSFAQKDLESISSKREIGEEAARLQNIKHLAVNNYLEADNGNK